MYLLKEFYKDFAKLNKLDWLTFNKIHEEVENTLYKIAEDKKLLSDLIQRMLLCPYLLSFSGENPFLKKLILHRENDSGIELRIHIFKVGTNEKPHNHRLSFSTIILNGGYIHTVYHCLKKEINNSLKMSDLLPVYFNSARKGTMYSMSHQAIHTTNILPDTITLIIRGPFIIPHWFNIDPMTEEVRIFDDGNKSSGFEKQNLLDTLSYLQEKNILEKRRFNFT